MFSFVEHTRISTANIKRAFRITQNSDRTRELFGKTKESPKKWIPEISATAHRSQVILKFLFIVPPLGPI